MAYPALFALLPHGLRAAREEVPGIFFWEEVPEEVPGIFFWRHLFLEEVRKRCQPLFSTQFKKIWTPQAKSSTPAPAMNTFSQTLAPGTLVRVRQRNYIIQDLVPAAHGASALLKLACIEDDAQGRRLDIAWDIETDAKIIPPERSALKLDRKPDEPKTFAAYLHALRWACVTSTDPTLFQAPLRAGIVPKSYQLEALRKALALPRVNLFIADDVGLGKTIEAGLVLQELLLRQRVDRVVVACPSSVVLPRRGGRGANHLFAALAQARKTS